MLGVGLSIWRQAVYGGGLRLPNLLRNSTMAGAVVSPDTLPTYWGMTTPVFSVARDIVGTGTDIYPYIDVRWSGTGSSTSSATLTQFDSNTAIAATVGTNYCASLYFSITAGALTNVTGLKLRVRYNDSGGVLLAVAEQSLLAATGTPARFSIAGGAAPASTAYCVVQLISNWALAAVDFTARIQGPMLNTGALPAVFQPTSP